MNTRAATNTDNSHCLRDIFQEDYLNVPKIQNSIWPIL
jgi:hypothetical protein